MEDDRLNTKEWFKISRNNLKWLYVYLSVLLLTSLVLTIITLLYESTMSCFSISQISLIGGGATALMGSSMFYLRKLYKSSIKKLMEEPVDNDGKIRELGILFYYYLRPIFAICFSVLFHLALKSSIAIISVSELILDSGMIYLTMTVSFFIGFAAGDMITRIESYSKEVINKATQIF